MRGTVALGEPALYVVRAVAGQVLNVHLRSKPNEAVGGIVPESCDNTCVAVSAHAQSGDLLGETMNSWRHVVQETGEYYFEVHSTLAPYAKDFSLRVGLADAAESEALAPAATRVLFDPGTTSSRMSGEVALGSPDLYVLRARQGQRLRLSLTSQPSGELAEIFPTAAVTPAWRERYTARTGRSWAIRSPSGMGPCRSAETTT